MEDYHYTMHMVLVTFSKKLCQTMLCDYSRYCVGYHFLLEQIKS